MSSMQRRRQLVKTTKNYGLHVQPAVLQTMLRYSGDGGTDEYLYPILECLQERLARVSGPKIITPLLWEEAVREATAEAVVLSERALVASSKSTAAGADFTEKKNASIAPSGPIPFTRGKHADWRVVDAFDTPTLVYDSLHQQFRFKSTSGPARPSLLGTVEDKIEMMTQRYLRVQQRVARSVSYLTSIDRLLGTNATASQTLLGLLRATSISSAMAQADGVAATGFELEDLTGSIPLHLHSSTILDASGIYTEGCIVLVEGHYDAGIFVVNELKLPPIEAKGKSQPFIPPAPNTFKFHSSSHAHNVSPLTLYTMANVALDEPVILQQLDNLIDNLCENMSTEQVVLVLMGNFTTNSMTLALALEELSRLLEPLPANHSVLIMPGPNDTPSMCWPIPRIKAPPTFSQNLNSNVQFVSNPCRLQYGEQQDVLLYRQDMIRQHLQNEILSVRSNRSASPGKEENNHAIGSRIFHTILSQGHLLPQAPIYWNFDYALGMYPLPDLMLVGLEEGEDNTNSFHDALCQILVPGSNGNWAKVALQPKHKLRRGGVRLPLQIEFSQSQNRSDDSENEDSEAESLMDED